MAKLTEEQILQMAKRLRQIKTKLKELKAEENKIKSVQERLEEALLDTITEDIPARPTRYGTLAKTSTARFSLDDAKGREQYIEETGDLSCIAASVPAEFAKNFHETHGFYPEWVRVYDDVRLSFTQPKAKTPKRETST